MHTTEEAELQLSLDLTSPERFKFPTLEEPKAIIVRPSSEAQDYFIAWLSNNLRQGKPIYSVLLDL